MFESTHLSMDSLSREIGRTQFPTRLWPHARARHVRRGARRRVLHSLLLPTFHTMIAPERSG